MTATARKIDTEATAISATRTGTVVMIAQRPARKFNLQKVLAAICRNVLPPLVVLIALLGILHHLRVEQAVGEGIIAQQQGENAGSVIRALPGAVLDGKRHGMNS